MSDIVARPYNKDYEITDAMFGAFRSPGGAKLFFKLLGWTTLLLTVLYFVAFPSIVRGYVDILAGLSAFDPANPDTVDGFDEVMSTAFLGMLPSLILLMVGSIAVIALVRAAFYRAYFHGETTGRFPFRIGADEGRQFLSQLGYWSLYLLGYVIFTALIIAMSALAAVTLGSGAAAIAVGLFVALIYIGLIVYSVWFLVKFAPAGALTGLRRKTHVFAARHVSRNRFWALFGALLVAFVIGYVASYIISLIGAEVAMPGLMDGSVLTDEDPASALQALLADSATPGFKIRAAFGILMLCAGTAFYMLMLLGPSAFFVRQWDELDPKRAFE